MLAKMWKKILLAICIIACIFNIMSKLVNRHSLESNLERANDGNTVLDSIRQENEVTNLNEENIVESENIIDNSNFVSSEENFKENTEDTRNY